MMENILHLHPEAREWSAAQAVFRLYHALDQSDYDGVLAQFEADGVWTRAGSDMTGHAQILSSLQKRPVTQVIRHVVSNFLVLSGEGRTLSARYYLTAYQFDSGAPAPLPAPISRPFLLADVTCRLRCAEDGVWRIRHLGLQRVFDFTA